jgi:feruloyl-CoA synthase
LSTTKRAPDRQSARWEDGMGAQAALAAARVVVEQRADSAIIIGSGRDLPTHARHVGEWLRRWAQEAPDRVFLAERAGDGWRNLTYQAARNGADAIAAALLAREHDATRPVATLGDNAINQALLKLGAMQAGIPVLPISPAYSLLSQTFDKLKHVVATMQPSVIYVPRAAPFAKALVALDLSDATLLLDRPDAQRPGAESLGDWLATPPDQAAEAAYERIGADSVAKILLTSGSTGMPKGVINTQRMMTANAAAIDQVWPFLGRRPPVIVDWLPWNHTFGTNFNFNTILRHGGTMYIDAGRPAPGRFDETLRNLRAVAPTLLYNVPRGFDMLVPALEGDDALARNVFRDLDIIFYAGAALPRHLWERLDTLARRHRGAPVPILSALGSTETAPVATLSHWHADDHGAVGLPVAGTTLKLVPNGGKLEMRVKGPNVTPGYYGDAARAREAFDDEGFFKLGDAVRFADAARPERGLIFDGRVAENFKLASGTWVHVGTLRLAVITACAPIVQDAVITGHDRDALGVLLFPNLPACRTLCGGAAAAPADVLVHPEIRRRLTAGLAAHNRDNPGSSMAIARALWLLAPPSIDANEITDKGYVNQRGVLAVRAELVARLHAGAPDPDVIVVGETGPAALQRAAS